MPEEVEKARGWIKRLGENNNAETQRRKSDQRNKELCWRVSLDHSECLCLIHRSSHFVFTSGVEFLRRRLGSITFCALRTTSGLGS